MERCPLDPLVETAPLGLLSNGEPATASPHRHRMRDGIGAHSEPTDRVEGAAHRCDDCVRDPTEIVAVRDGELSIDVIMTQLSTGQSERLGPSLISMIRDELDNALVQVRHGAPLLDDRFLEAGPGQWS